MTAGGGQAGKWVCKQAGGWAAWRPADPRCCDGLMLWSSFSRRNRVEPHAPVTTSAFACRAAACGLSGGCVSAGNMRCGLAPLLSSSRSNLAAAASRHAFSRASRAQTVESNLLGPRACCCPPKTASSAKAGALRRPGAASHEWQAIQSARPSGLTLCKKKCHKRRRPHDGRHFGVARSAAIVRSVVDVHDAAPPKLAKLVRHLPSVSFVATQRSAMQDVHEPDVSNGHDRRRSGQASGHWRCPALRRTMPRNLGNSASRHECHELLIMPLHLGGPCGQKGLGPQVHGAT